MIRAKLLNSGLRLFAEQGYSQVTMRDLAEAAACPLETVYKHYPSKTDLVMSLYHRLAVQLEERISELPTADLATRFAKVMEWKTSLLEPHRAGLLALFEHMSDPEADLGVLSRSTEPIRVRVTGVFASVVYGADQQKDPPVELIRLLYRLHLGLVWLWFKEPRLYRGMLAASKTLLALSSPLVSYKSVEAALRAADRLSGALAAPNDLQWDQVAEKVLRRVFLRRRMLTPDSPCHQEPCALCLAPHLAKVQAFVDKNEPIHLVLPAFPAKSPNPEKTLGKLPDLGESIALRTLQTLCDEIADLYPPGARVTICSDGHVFSDLVEVTDEDVTAYHHGIAQVIRDNQHKNLALFHLADLHGDSPDYPKLRNELMENYGEHIEDLKRRTKLYPHHASMLDGIHRFMFEDRVVLHPEVSRNQNRKRAREVAYQVVLRSNAWSRVVAEHFPQAVRLSIHPQTAHSEKIGFLLTRAVDNWITPWHGSILLKDDEFLLMKRQQAEDSGANVVKTDGLPSHFETSSETPCERNMNDKNRCF